MADLPPRRGLAAECPQAEPCRAPPVQQGSTFMPRSRNVAVSAMPAMRAPAARSPTPPPARAPTARRCRPSAHRYRTDSPPTTRTRRCPRSAPIISAATSSTIAIEAVTRKPDRIAGSAPGSTILRTIAPVDRPKLCPMRISDARHVIDAAGRGDHRRKEHAERQGDDLRALADAEPDDEQRHQRDLRNREQRRHHRHAGRAQRRPQPDRQPHADAEHRADAPADRQPHQRRRQMLPQLAAHRQVPQFDRRC